MNIKLDRDLQNRVIDSKFRTQLKYNQFSETLYCVTNHFIYKLFSTEYLDHFSLQCV